MSPIAYWDIAVTQGHFSMDDREPVKVATLEEFVKNKNFAHENPEEEPKDKPATSLNRSIPISTTQGKLLPEVCLGHVD